MAITNGVSGREARISRAQRRNLSIISRHSPFSRLEAQAFIQPIREYLLSVEKNSHSLKRADMLAVEKDAFLKVGLESDLNDMRTCRRKAFDQPISRESDLFWEAYKNDYVDFLLNLAKTSPREEARDILLRVRAVERDNWHALKELAIIYTIEEKPSLALQYFAEAKAVLAESRTKYDISEPAVIEIAHFEGRALALTENGVPLGDKRAAPEYLRYRLDVLLRRDEAGAKKLATEIKRGKYIPRLEAKAMEAELRERIAGFRRDERAAKIIDKLDALSMSRASLIGDHKLIGREICGALKEAGDENRTIIEEEVLGLIAGSIKDKDKILGAVLLSDLLVRSDQGFGSKVKEFYRKALTEKCIREFIRDILFGIRGQVQSLAGEVKGAVPQNEEFRRGQIFYDFFAKTIGRAEVEPYSIASIWFMEKANLAEDRQQAVNLLKIAIKEDPSNIHARIELASQLSAMGRRQESQKVIKGIGQKEITPTVDLLILEVEAGNLAAVTDGNLKNIKPVAKELAQVREMYGRAKEIYTSMDRTGQERGAIKAAMKNIRLSAARVHEMAGELDKAAALYDEVLAEDPLHEAAVRERSGILFLQGRLPDAVLFFTEKIGLDGKLNPKKRNPYLFCFLAESLFQLAEEKAYMDALAAIDNAIRLGNYLEFRLIKARLLAVLGRTQKAELALAEAKGFIEGKRPGLNEFDRSVIDGLYAMAAADICMSKQDWPAVLENADLAAKMFSRSHSTKFQELDARWYALNLLTKMAKDGNDGKTLASVAGEAERLLRKHPYYPPFHQALVSPLMLLGREKEALGHIRWLIDNLNGMSLDVFANLLIILHESNDIPMARELFVNIRKKMGENSFGRLLQMGHDMIIGEYPELERMLREAAACG